MTSTTITRLCDSAVVWRRSIASVAICTAVWKPNVKSVPPRSLSIVLGTPTTGTPSSAMRGGLPLPAGQVAGDDPGRGRDQHDGQAHQPGVERLRADRPQDDPHDHAENGGDQEAHAGRAC